MTDFKVLHGEAVAMGIALDTVYSGLTGRLPDAAVSRTQALLQTLGFALTHPLMRVTGPDSPIFTCLQEFREHLGGRLTIMLLREIGHGE